MQIGRRTKESGAIYVAATFIARSRQLIAFYEMHAEHSLLTSVVRKVSMNVNQTDILECTRQNKRFGRRLSNQSIHPSITPLGAATQE